MNLRSDVRCGLVLLFGAALFLAFLQPASGMDGDETPDAKYDGRTIDEWIRVWDGDAFQASQQAKAALIQAGPAAVAPLSRLIRDNHRHAGYALKTLAEMGPAAKPALAEMLKLARNRAAKDPDGWTWNVSIRVILFMSFAKMTWASDELVPLLEHVGEDEAESDQIRGIAVNSLGGMGVGALPALRRFAESDNQHTRRSAVSAIVAIESAAGKDANATRQEFIDKNPFDSNVPEYLVNMKGGLQSRPTAPADAASQTDLPKSIEREARRADRMATRDADPQRPREYRIVLGGPDRRSKISLGARRPRGKLRDTCQRFEHRLRPQRTEIGIVAERGSFARQAAIAARRLDGHERFAASIGPGANPG